jgi:hypothetical protein
MVTDHLLDVWGSGASDIYAVGYNGRILHSTGNGDWTPLVSGTAHHLRGVWGRGPDDVFAVGEAGVVLHHP